MNNYKISAVLLSVILSFVTISCKKFDEANDNPNSAEKVSSNYILSYVLTQTAKT